MGRISHEVSGTIIVPVWFIYICLFPLCLVNSTVSCLLVVYCKLI